MAHSVNVGPSAEIIANDAGRLTIPAPVRRAAGIEPGQKLVVYVEDRRVVIETRAQLAERIRRDVGANWTGEGSVVDELITDRRTEARTDLIRNGR